MSYIKGKISPRPGNKRNGKSRKSEKQRTPMILNLTYAKVYVFFYIFRIKITLNVPQKV